MASGKSCSKGLWNGPLYTKNLRRFWPLWGLACLVWFLIAPLPVLASRMDGALSPGSLREQVLNLHYIAMLLGGATGMAAALCVFRFLFTDRASNAMHALPLRREGLFAVSFASGLSLGLIPVAFTGLSLLGSQLLACGFVDWYSLGCLLAVLGAATLFGFALAAVCCVITGSMPAAVIFFVALNGAAAGVWCLGSLLVDSFTFGLNYAHEPAAVRWLTPIWQLTDNAYTAWEAEELVFRGLASYGVYALAALALGAIALALYRRRPAEHAGDVIAFSWLRPVFRVLLSLGAALALTMFCLLVYAENRPAFALVLALLALWSFAGWFAAEMLLQKSFRVFRRKKLTGWAVFFLLLAAVCCGFRFDLLGTQARVPDPAEVQSAELSYGGWGDWEAQPETVTALHQTLLDHRQELERLSGTDLTITYTLKNGKTLSRCYSLYWDDAELPEAVAQPLVACLTDPEAVTQRVFDRGSLTAECLTEAYWRQDSREDARELSLYGDDARALLAAFSADVAAGRYLDPPFENGQLDWEGDGDTLEFTFGQPQDRQYVSVTLNAGMTQTLAALAELAHWNA